MFNVLTSLVLVICVTNRTLFAYNFEEKFARLFIEKSDLEQQVYGASADGIGSNEEHTTFFPQKLDHFKSTAKALWNQRSIIFSMYYKKNGPFFLYLFGNKEASADWLRKSKIMSHAKDSQALVIGLEHRFYGDSRPFPNTSLENLNYLNIQQALADVAYFIGTVNEISFVPASTKWILFGGFYGGSLAAWARLKYPHLVHGAVASGALISIKSEYPEYLESIKNAYFSHDRNCAKNIELAFQQINDLLQTQEGRTNISKKFRLCDSLENNEDDFAIFRGILSQEISAAVEQNHDDSYSMFTVCNFMNRQSTSAIENMRSVNARYLRQSNCWYSKAKIIISMYQDDRYERREQSVRLWQYQLCTQFGFNLPSTKSANMFGEYKPEVESLARYCKDIFGPNYNQQTIDGGVKETNLEFGGSMFNKSRVIFVEGSLDPWKAAGIAKTPEKVLYDIIQVKGASHLADLESSYPDDDLENGIREIKDLLKSWLA